MEKLEKIRILKAAVDAAVKNGFDFLNWYKEKLDLVSNKDTSIFLATKIHKVTQSFFSFVFLRVPSWLNFFR